MTRETDMIFEISRRVTAKEAPRNNDIGKVLSEVTGLASYFRVKLQGYSKEIKAKNMSSASIRIGDYVNCQIYTSRGGKISHVEITGISSRQVGSKRIVWV